VDDGRPIAEATIIIEYLGVHHPGPASLIPEDASVALEARFLDRFFDNYVQTPVTKIVTDRLRAPEERDAKGVADARQLLDTAYRWLESRMAGLVWATGESFTLADCAAAPSLFYADWAHPIGNEFAAVWRHLRRPTPPPPLARSIAGRR